MEIARPLIIADKGALTPEKISELEREGYLVVEKMRGMDVQIVAPLTARRSDA